MSVDSADTVSERSEDLGYRLPPGLGPPTRPKDREGFTLDTLMVRKIDDLGRVVVPAETRRLFNIHEGDELAITVENGGIVLRKLEDSCVFCDSTEGPRATSRVEASASNAARSSVTI